MINTKNFSNEKLAAQLLFPKIETDKYFDDEKYQDRIHNLIESGVGGFCVFHGNTENVPVMIQTLQARAEIPLLFCADFEHGLPMRLDDGTDFPHAWALGSGDNLQNTFKTAKAIAKEAASLGIRWNLAPVVDINSNKNNPVINIRSFGEDPEIVSKHAIEYMRGTQQDNLLACAKHFPGHGDTAVDSHLAMPTLTLSKERIEEFELIPFKKSIEAGVRSIMVGHLSVPAYDDSPVPASLSKKIVTELLKGKLGYKGLIITDALEMKAISSTYTSSEAAYYSVMAGNDIVLMPENDEEALESLIDNINKNDDFKNRVEESFAKIYSEKRWAKLIPQFAILKNDQKVFIDNQKMALNVAYNGVKKFGDEAVLPIKPEVSFAGFAFIERNEDFQSASRFFTMMSQALENDCDLGYIDTSITDEQLKVYQSQIFDDELIVFCIFNKSRAYQGTIAIDTKVNEIMEKLALGRKSITILFGNPYLQDNLKSDLFIKTYSDSFASLAAAVVELSGRKEALKL